MNFEVYKSFQINVTIVTIEVKMYIDTLWMKNNEAMDLYCSDM